MTHQSPRRVVITCKDGSRHVFDADSVTCVLQMDHEGQTLDFEYGFVNLDLMDAIPPDLQRRFGQKFHDWIVANHDWRRVRITACRRPDGTQGPVSGQHCGKATRQKGFTHWPAFIVPVKDDADEAWQYDGNNTARPRKPADTTRVRCYIGDPDLKPAVELARSEGCVYQTEPAWNNIADPAVLVRLIKAHGEEHVRTVLRYIVSAWEDKAGACQIQNIYAISYLLRNWRTPAGKFPSTEVLKALRRLNPRTLARQAPDAGMGTDSSVAKVGIYIARYIAEGVFSRGKKDENKLRHI